MWNPWRGIKRHPGTLALQSVDRLIVHNNASREELVKLGVDPAKISVIPHGNYLAKVPALMNPVEARSVLGIRQDAKVALFFGQIKQVKVWISYSSHRRRFT